MMPWCGYVMVRRNISPEQLLTNLQWQEMLCSEVYQRNLVAFVVDEAHTVSK